MNKKDNDIVYLTLIDFLIQLIFFSLFVFVIFNKPPSSNAPIYSAPKWVNDKIYAPILEGFGPFIRVENVKKFEEIWKYLKSQKDLDNLLEALKYAKTTDELKRSADLVSKGGGVEKVEKKIIGKKSCLKDGSTTSIFSFDAYDTFIRVNSISDIGKQLLQANGINIKEGQRVNKSEIRNKFFKFFNNNCVYYVDYIRHTDSEQMRNEVEKNFYIRRK
ncbi:MAG: hypothetical protein P8Q17_06205 [Methylophilaceae bacterium]|nr:hypothetical protein [Methylophilaceae bacterium]